MMGIGRLEGNLELRRRYTMMHDHRCQRSLDSFEICIRPSGRCEAGAFRRKQTRQRSGRGRLAREGRVSESPCSQSRECDERHFLELGSTEAHDEHMERTRSISRYLTFGGLKGLALSETDDRHLLVVSVVAIKLRI